MGPSRHIGPGSSFALGLTGDRSWGFWPFAYNTCCAGLTPWCREGPFFVVTHPVSTLRFLHSLAQQRFDDATATFYYPFRLWGF